MGLRVRAVLMALLLMSIAALSVPLAISQASHRTTTLIAERDRQLSTLADAAATPGAPLAQLLERYHQVYGEGVLIADTDGQVVAASGLSMADPGVLTTAELALSDAPMARPTRLWPWSQQNILAAKGIRRNGELAGAVVLAISPVAAEHDITTALLWITLGGAALLALTFAVAQGLTQWVLRPVRGLERAVDDMAGGIAGRPARVSGPPELRRFTAAFNAMAEAVGASLDHQRRLIADASHQLRNPLAAVRLRADTLQANVTSAGQPTYDSLSAELDRLEHLLTQLLRLARAEEASHTRRTGLGGSSTDSTDLDSVATQRVNFWQPAADGNDQKLIYRAAEQHLSAQLPRHDVEQLLDIALDNAVRHSGSGTTITVSVAPSGAGIDLAVSDDGRGLPGDTMSRAATRFWRGETDSDGTGLGLAIATEIAAAHGGSTTVEAAPEGGLMVRYHLPAGSRP